MLCNFVYYSLNRISSYLIKFVGIVTSLNMFRSLKSVSCTSNRDGFTLSASEIVSRKHHVTYLPPLCNFIPLSGCHHFIVHYPHVGTKFPTVLAPSLVIAPSPPFAPSPALHLHSQVLCSRAPKLVVQTSKENFSVTTECSQI